MPKRPQTAPLAPPVHVAREAAAKVEQFGRWLGGHVNLPGMQSRSAAAPIRVVQPGSAPGIEYMDGVDQAPAPDVVRFTCYDYCSDRLEEQKFSSVADFLAAERPDWSCVRWLNVDGLQPFVVNKLREAYGFHTLAAEDVMRTPQRPKAETYADHLFVVLRMMTLKDSRIDHEQVSVFLFENLVVTFQERPGDVFDPIRQRLQKASSRLRTMGASYLLYALMDAVVDHCFPILENYGELLDEIEEEVTADPDISARQRIQAIKRELGTLRRVIWPMRDVANQLHREELAVIAPEVRAYLRDVYDHAMQVMEVMETYRETAAGLNDLYLSTVSQRMNEVMKVLTLLSSFFIPITFVAGVYGMNFEHIPELSWKYSYLAFWGVCATITTVLLYYFWRNGWLKKD